MFTVTLFRFPNAVHSKFPVDATKSDTEKFVQKIIRTKCSNNRSQISLQEQS